MAIKPSRETGTEALLLRVARLEQWCEKISEANRQNLEGFAKAIYACDAHIIVLQRRLYDFHGPALVRKQLSPDWTVDLEYYYETYNRLAQVGAEGYWARGMSPEEAVEAARMAKEAEEAAKSAKVEEDRPDEQIFGGDYGQVQEQH